MAAAQGRMSRRITWRRRPARPTSRQPASSNEHKLADPRVLDLVSRIECTYDRDMDAFGSFQRRTRVELEPNDGRMLSTTGELRGMATNPLTRQDVVEKLGKVTRRLLEPETQAALIEQCDRLEALDDVRPLTALLRLPSGSVSVTT